ncbi:DEAD/DEAH box helicase [Tardiphaga sp. 20_F10_N6_6]|uniref:DEAD/DEAH box helicase n=1 Tax=Tardiphaga sp. 20_F10_N6_6 TaxID=3240788 RepID=UPI003F8B24CA
MTIVLRDYQHDMVARARSLLRRARRVLMQAPTGAGKTALASFMIGGAAQRGQLAYFICHRSELITQTSRTFSKYGIQHSFIAAGMPYDARQRVQICSIDTLKVRKHVVPEPNLAVWDECHHIAAAGWLAVMEGWKRAYHIGLSATPQRTDGAGLDAMFDEMIIGPSVAWLIEHGHLARYTAFIPEGGMNVAGVGKRMGDFIAKDVEAKVNRPKLVGDIIKHWRKHAGGRRTIAFAPSLDFSMYMVSEFQAASIRAEHLDGNTPKDERRNIISAYADGQIDVLWNRYLFGEGFDLAAIAQRDITIDCVIDAAPTMALNMAMQRWGRAMRGEHAVILDHAGNMLRHGFPDDEREWSLQGREKSGAGGANDGPPPPIICEGCFNAIRRPAPPLCHHCNKPLRAEVKPIEVGEGELIAANDNDKAAVRAKLKEEERACRTASDWIALEKRRGHKHGWGLRRYNTDPRRIYGKLSA